MPVEHLAQLYRHEKVTFQLVLLYQQDVPQLMKVRVRLEPQLYSFPSSPSLWPLALISQKLSEFFKVFLGASRVFRKVGFLVEQLPCAIDLV